MLGPELARLSPSEVLVSEATEDRFRELVEEVGASLTALGRAAFDSQNAEVRLKSLFSVASLESFGGFERAEISAMGALIEYLDITQKGQLPRLQRPNKEVRQRVMQIDAATRRNLEITRSILGGGRAGSLLETVDGTVTAGGGRLLEQRISSPSMDIGLINNRLDCIQYMLDHPADADALRQALRQVPDLDRALSRIALDRAGPRDLVCIRSGLTQSSDISMKYNRYTLPVLLNDALKTLNGFDDLVALLHNALVDEPPLLSRDGGFVATGYDAELDETRQLRDEGRSIIAQMQQEYIQQTEISSLKIKHNNVLGYFVETTATHADKMMAPPLNETFIHRQTTANQVRFTTVPLSEIETKILNAGNHAIELEKRIYQSLTKEILRLSDEISGAASGLAELDIATSLAKIAQSNDWARPTVDNSKAFEISGGRHPVVEAALQSDGARFVANDCALSDGKVWLLTGPNMAGKSTFLRQNALIAILAQAGSYVPANHAQIGAVSQLFSRVGASDDLARGRSTFMVEMVETAAILNQADDRALVILDEIGRGTATYDGLSIAWATLEHIHDVNKSRALFATHYHEMTALADKMDNVENATVTVKEWEGDVIFLHEVKKGAADRSYGVQVAKIAGLPNAVVERARVVLDALEQGEREGSGAPKAIIDDLPLFAATPTQSAPTTSQPNKIEQMLSEILPDELTPREALQKLYELKGALK